MTDSESIRLARQQINGTSLTLSNLNTTAKLTLVDAINELDGRFPNLTGIDSITFNTAASVTITEGVVAWNAADATLDIGMLGGTILQVGQEQLVKVLADADILNGQAVYASGAQGIGSGRMKVSLYSSSHLFVDELYFLGIATQDIANGNEGYITTFGKVRDVLVSATRASDDPAYASPATSGWDIGTILYISPTDAGKFTSTAPTHPDKSMPVAMIVSKNGIQRTFFVRSEHGYHLNEIHDVKITGLANNDLLSYDSALGVWKNKAVSFTASGISFTPAGSIGSTNVQAAIQEVDTDTQAVTTRLETFPFFEPSLQVVTPYAGAVQSSGSASGSSRGCWLSLAVNASSQATSLYATDAQTMAGATGNAWNHARPSMFRFRWNMLSLDVKRCVGLRFYVGVPHSGWGIPNFLSDPLQDQMRGFGFEIRRKGNSGDATTQHQVRLFARNGKYEYAYTAVTTNGSNQLTVVAAAIVTSIAATLALGQTVQITGTNIPAGTFATSASGTTVTMNQTATGNGTITATAMHQGVFGSSAWTDMPDNWSSPSTTADRCYDAVLKSDGAGNLSLWLVAWKLDDNSVPVHTTPIVTLSGTSVPVDLKSAMTYSAGIRTALVADGTNAPTASTSNQVYLYPSWFKV